MIIDSKVSLMLSQPPPYQPPSASSPPTLDALPPHILLHIVYSTFPQTPSIDHGKVQRQRKTLLWLVNSLRLVNRSFYIACMHVLRSTYLPAYQSLIRPPYTSDPFPSSTTSDSSAPSYTLSGSSAGASAPQPISSLQRETPILDRFIALKVREDVFVDDSELHLEREDMFKDLFDLAQPKARLEDLVRMYGLREGVISVGGASSKVTVRTDELRDVKRSQPSSSSPVSSPPPPSYTLPQPQLPSRPPSSSSTFRLLSSVFKSSKSKSPTPPSVPPSPPPPAVSQSRQITPILFSSLSISFSPRTIGLVVGAGTPRKRTIVQVDRGGRDESLEVGAKKIVKQLKRALIDGDV